MRKSGLLVPVAALLSGVFSAAAQEPARDFRFPSLEPSLSTNLLAPERTTPPISVAATRREPLAGNPLWAIPIGELTETHARPLFSPSRRPPAPPVLAALPAPAVNPARPVKSEPDRPLLTLVGTIVSESTEIGVFTDETSHDVIRLKAGDVHDGWTLSSVVGRATFFQKEGYPAATLTLPTPGVEATVPSIAGNAITLGNRQLTGVPPANTFVPPVIPASTKGESRRPPREG